MSNQQSPILDALKIINAPGHLILDNDKKPHYPARDWQVPSEQLAIDTAIQYFTQWGNLVRGIAAIMGSGLLALDFDPIEQHHLDAAEKYRITRQEIDDTRAAIMDASRARTYVESSYARGTHIIFRVSQSFIGRRAARLLKRCFAIDVLHGNKYCHITGKRLNDLTPLDATEHLQQLFSDIERAYPEPTVHSATGEIGVDWLEDSEVWQVLSTQRPDTYAKIAYAGECDFSDVINIAIGDLAKITSSAAQVHRMLARSPLVTSSIKCEGGRTDRSRKFEKLFDKWWQDSQESNVAGVPLITRNETRLPSIEHGAAIYAQLVFAEQQEQQIRIKEAAQREQAKLQQHIAADNTEHTTHRTDLEQTIHYLSCGIPSAFLDDAHAPDNLEALIQFNTRGMKVPFRKFAVLSTLGVFGSILGRKYKTEDNISAALLILLGAQSSSGKGEAFSFWQAQIARASQGQHGLRNRIYTGTGAGSAEALHDIAQQSGSMCWLVNECASLLGNLTSDDTQRSTPGLRDKVNDLFDASKHWTVVSPPPSIAAKNRGSKPIYNCTVGMLWSTTDELMRETFTKRSLFTGLGSRLLASIHKGIVGESVDQHEVLRALPGEWNMWLTNLLLQIEELDALYETDQLLKAEEQIVYVKYSPDAARLKRSVEKCVDKIRNAIASGRASDYYTMFLRVPVLAAKIGLISATVNGRQIEYIDYAWGLGLVLRIIGEVVEAFDSGEIDVQLSDVETIVLETFKMVNARPGAQQEGFVRSRDLRLELSRNKTLKKLANKNRTSVTILFDGALKALVESEILVGERLKTDGKARAPFIFYKGESSYWKN